MVIVERTLIQIAAGTSNLLVVIIAVEGFIDVWFPMKICNLTYMLGPKIQMVAVYLLSAACFCIPNAIRFRITFYQDIKNHHKMWRVTNSNYYNTHYEDYLISSTSVHIIYYVVSEGVVLVCNLATILGLWMAAQSRKDMTQSVRHSKTYS